MLGAIKGSWVLLSSREKKILTLLGLGSVLINLLDLLAISLVGIIGASGFGGEVRLPFLPAGALDFGVQLPILLAITACLFASKTALALLISRSQNHFLARIDAGFSIKIAAHVFGGGLTTMRKLSQASVEWAILRSTEIAFQRVLGTALTVLGQFTLVIMILGLFFYTEWFLTLVVFAYFLAVFSAFQFLSKKRSQDYGAGVAEGSVSLSRALGDMVSSFKEISVLSRLGFFLEKINTAKTRVAMGHANQLYLQSMPRLIVELALIIGAIGFLAFQFMIEGSSPNFGVLSIFVVGSLRLTSALLPLQRGFMDLRFLEAQAKGAQEIVASVQHEFVRVKEASTLQEPDSDRSEDKLWQFPIGVQVTDLRFRYPEDSGSRMVLKGLNFAIQAGSSVAFIGPSGSGKSTLIDLLLGLLEPTEGEVLLNSFSPQQIRNWFPGTIGYVPQKPGLVSGTIRDNVALGVPNAEIDDEAVWNALKQAKLEDFVHSMEGGIQANLGNHSDSLSGGQAQRLGLARALYSRPRLLVLDEATSALDAETEASITSELKTLKGATTVITVAHRLSTVKSADNVIILDQGDIITQGKFGDLVNNSTLLQRYVSLMRI